MLKSIQEAIQQLNTIEWLALCFFCIIFLFRMIYLLVFTGRVFFLKKHAVRYNKGKPISLILTLRNEEENIEAYLPPLLNISNVDYEVVAVDDFSSDNSMSILGAIKNKYPNLKISCLNQETWYSVKMAQNLAIKASGYDWVMVIPPTLCQFKQDWLKAVTSSVNLNQDVVVSYSNVKPAGTFFNNLYRTENFFQQVKSAGFILNRLPFIISEENVAFRKDKYFAEGGYRHKVSEPYANLELLINNFIKTKNTSILYTEETSVFRDETISKSLFFDLLKKEIRIRRHLRLSRKIFLFTEEFTESLFLPATLILIFLIPPLLPILSILFTVIILIRIFIIKKAIRRLNERKLFLSSLIYALLLPYFKLGYRFYYNQHTHKKCRHKK